MAVPKNIFLLRKSRAGKEALVLKSEDFPLRFQHGDKNYVVTRTKKGGVVMTSE